MDRPPTPEHMERINRLVDALYAPGAQIGPSGGRYNITDGGYIKETIFRRFFFPIITSYEGGDEKFARVYDKVLLYEYHSDRVKRRQDGISKQDFIDYLKDKSVRPQYTFNPFGFDEFMDLLEALLKPPPPPIPLDIIQRGGPARFKVNVQPTNTIEDIRQFIKSKLESTYTDRTHTLQIIYLEREIDDTQTIASLHIKPNDSIYFVFNLRPPPIPLDIIQHGGPARFKVNVQPTNTIEDIKRFIKSKLEPTYKEKTIFKHALRIIYLGREIEDNTQTLASLHIKPNNSVYFVFNLREKGLGGKKSRKSKKIRKSRKV